MKFKNCMQLKSLLKNKANENHIPSQLVMQNYLLEILLERLASSKYNHNFIIKGGFLIAAIVGLNSRTTMDLDTTITGFPLTPKRLQEIFNDICNLPAADNFQFKLSSITEIREKDEYPGLRVSLTACYPPINAPLSVDVTTGDIITPSAITFGFPKMFEPGKINCLTYSIETILAEKLETIISRSTASTRPRDYYDVFIISSLKNYNQETLKKALVNTANKRNSREILSEYKTIINDIRTSQHMNTQWQSYAKQFEYARNIDFKSICKAIEDLLNDLFE